MPNRHAVTVALLAVVLTCAAPSSAVYADQPARGPIVVVPDCRIEGVGCNLDPNTPALNPHACATTIAKLLERRGISSTQPGPVADVCAADPNALALLATIRASCATAQGDRLALPFAELTRLSADVEVRDCASGTTAGRGRTARAVEKGRRTLLRDAVEELAHHISIHEIRRTHQEIPLRWMGADVGSEYSIELRGGFVDVGRSSINGFFRAAGVSPDDTASRETLELAYHPWSRQGARLAVGLDALQMQTSGHASFDTSLLHLAPRITLTSARTDAVLRAIGPDFSAAYGWDYTRHQRISFGGSFGYYVLGTSVAPSKIQIEGIAADSLKLQDSAFGFGAEARWEWRLTPHIGVSAAWGWNVLNFYHPRLVRSNTFLPYNVEFTGQTGRLGIAARF